MHQRSRRRVSYLFAKATALLEDAHIIAAAGQSLDKSILQLRRHARDLRKAGTGLQELAAAIERSLTPSRQK